MGGLSIIQKCIMSSLVLITVHSGIVIFKDLYRIAGMFGRDKVWRITSSKVVGEKKFGECLQQRCVTYEMD